MYILVHIENIENLYIRKSHLSINTCSYPALISNSPGPGELEMRRIRNE